LSLEIQLDNDTYKVICQQCQHYIRVDEASAENYENNPETFQCELCYVAPGDPKPLLRKFINCSQCLQTYDSRSTCECPPQVSSIKITYPQMKLDRDKDYGAYNSRTTLDFNKRVRNRKLEAEQRQIRVDENLQKTVELLEKIVKQKESKDVQEE